MTAQLRLTVVGALATLLAAIGLSSVFADGAWLWPVIGSVVVSAGACALARRVGVPRPIIPLVGLAALVLLITWMYTRHAVWGFFPGPGALRELHAQLAAAGDDVRRFATPAPTSQPLLLLAVGGIGAVAVAVDTLAVTFRTAALAGVPLLAVYAVPASVSRGGVSWVLFVAAALGWLALMLAEGRERLSGWGRALGRRSSRGDGVFTSAPAEPLGVVGRRIGAAALGLAVIFPAAVPLLGDSLFSGNGNGTGGGGGNGSGSGITTINPLVSIAGDLTARSNTEVFGYHSTDSNPDYLRMVTLDTFDGPKSTWDVARLSTAGSASSLDASATDQPPGTLVTTQVAVAGLRTPWLPLPYPAQSIKGLTGGWSYDAATLDVFAKGNTTTIGRNYTVTSLHPGLDSAMLRAVPEPSGRIKARYTALPLGIPALVMDTELQVTKGLSNEYDKALALQQFFLEPRNGFKYTTNLPDSTGSPLVAFLSNKQGFCQQYATMYAVMARLAGLPTRINVGFTHGSATTPGNWVVTRQNAHAWPEVYFEGIGWVRFEPTPSAPSGVENPSYASAPGPGGVGSVGGPPVVISQGEHNGHHDDRDLSVAGTSATPTAAATKPAAQRVWLVAGGSLVAALLLLSPAAARLVRRGRRLRSGRRGVAPATRVLEAWDELADTGRDLGLPWAASRTPRRLAEALVAYGVRGESAAAVRRLARSVERVRYARSGVDVLGGHDPGADARLVVKAMASASARKLRWRARLMPASVLSVAGARAADALDWVDGLGARTRGAIGRMLPRRLAGG